MAQTDYPVIEIRNSFHSNDGGSNTTDVYEVYDRFGRTKSQRWYRYGGTAAVLDDFGYAYDYAGNRTVREVQNVSGAPTNRDQSYTYDALHRLTNTKEGTYASGSMTKRFEQNYTLDALGNWSKYEEDYTLNSAYELVHTRAHNAANEVGTITTTTGSAWASPVHDAAGNMTTIPETHVQGTSSYTLKYDAWNRMVEAKESSTVLGTYAYDGLNRRASKTAGGVTYHYYYNENWQVLETRKGTDTDPWEQNVWHTYYIDALALRHYDASVGGTQVTHYFAHDANFNHTAVFDTSKNVIERYWYYTAYGDPGVLDANYAADSDEVSDIANTTSYTGRSLDTETGLYYYRNRYYHAQLGRFVARDPIGYGGANANLYQYVRGMPVVDVDSIGWIGASEVSDAITNLTEWLNSLKVPCACELAVSGIPNLVDAVLIPDNGNTPENWAWQHCMSNCLMVSQCGGDSEAGSCAESLSLAKELLDVVGCFTIDGGDPTGEYCRSAFQQSDFDDNSAGREAGMACYRNHCTAVGRTSCCAGACQHLIGIREGEGTDHPYGPFGGPDESGATSANN